MYKSTFKITILTIVVLVLTGICFGQKSPHPKPVKEKLLNELDVLIWRERNAEKLSVSIRIHSGSAFDPEGKDGAFRLLTEVMFPDTGTFEEFEELGGSLTVRSNFDYVQIDVVADNDKLVTVLEILADSLSKPVINKETTEAAKKSLLEKLQKSFDDPKYVADAAVAERLYGTFPYGRSQTGTEETLADIDFADLVFLRQRFLDAGNATLAIRGDVDTRFAYRAARRLLGSWHMGDGRVPSNFTLPEDPDTAPLTVNTDNANIVEERLAVEAKSRKDADYYTALVLADIMEKRFASDGMRFRFESFLLRGYFVLSRTADEGASSTDGESESKTNELIEALKLPITEDEFKASKTLAILAFAQRNPFDVWFDLDTYGIKSADDEYSKLNSVTLSDVNKLAALIAKNPVVEVNVVPAEPVEMENDGDPNDPR